MEKFYEAIILNDEVKRSWGEFLMSYPVRILDNYSIETSNQKFDRLCRDWVNKVARERVPPDGDIEQVKKVLFNHFVDD